MLVAFLSHAGDIALLKRQLLWIEKLGGCKAHKALLVLDAGVPFWSVVEASEIAARCFAEYKITATDKPYIGWPVAANEMFHHAAEYIAEHFKERWLLMEPDAIPLKAGWLDALASIPTDKAFIGAIETATTLNLPPRVMSGVAIYPADAATRLPRLRGSPRAWQVDAAEIMVRDGEHTNLIRDFFGQLKLPPVFVDRRTEQTPKHAFTLDWLPEQAVLFHRDKQHSLLPLLARKLGIPWTGQHPLLLVLPFCNKDTARMHDTIHWMRALGGCQDFDALLSYENTTSAPWVGAIRLAARQTFRSVQETSYAPPKPGEAAQTMAWLHVANYVAATPRPWLWHEADAIPLKPNWLGTLEAEYFKHGKPFAGPRVNGMAHYNGCMIYAGNTPELLPNTCAARHCIWDVHSAAEMAPQAVDIGHLHFHCWGMVGSHFHPFAGEAPRFHSQNMVNMIPPTAVVLHRCKDGSLIQRLKEKYKL